MKQFFIFTLTNGRQYQFEIGESGRTIHHMEGSHTFTPGNIDMLEMMAILRDFSHVTLDNKIVFNTAEVIAVDLYEEE